MKRKDFLHKGLAATVALPALLSSCQQEGASASGPAIVSNKVYRWRMVTTWAKNFPVTGEVANLLAQWVKDMSGGRLEIEVYGDGELVPALEVFDAVSAGTAEMGCGAAYYWAGKSAAAQFFAAVPFGLNAQQINAWLQSAGGYDLWKELYANFNLVPFPGGNTGVQMGGWFNKEINSIADLRGLKMRIPGLGGKTLEKAGGAAVLVSGTEVYTSLERGVIDAAEWIGPYHDYKKGFHKIAKYYYYPGWHETGSQLEFFVNKQQYESLPADLQAILHSATMRAQAWVLAEFDAQNAIHLDKLINEEKVQLRAFPQDVVEALRGFAKEVIEETVANDPASRKVYDSYRAFQQRIRQWSAISEQAFYSSLSR